MEITKDDRMLMALVEDKFRQADDQYRISCTHFLDMRQRSLVSGLCDALTAGSGQIRHVFFGGYEDAERTILAFLPDYADTSDLPLSVLRVTAPSAGRKLSHRDYLGSLTGSGISREMTGDILVNEEGADIIILDDIRQFLLSEYSRAGRVPIRTGAVDIGELRIPDVRTVTVNDTVASLRLDNIISSAFRMSRSKAADAVRSGLVFVDNIECTKTDMKVDEGSKLVLRGKGKAYLREVGSRTRKDRIYIMIERYV